MKNKILLIMMMIMASIFSCMPPGDERPEQTKPRPKDGPPLVKVIAPQFIADSAFAFIEKQVSFGPRVPNTKAHAQTADWLMKKLESYGLNVIVQEAKLKAFDNTILNAKNIIAEHNPDAKNRILLMAHWDTRPFADQDTKERTKPIDGANDGASGVGVLLEIARLISQQPPNVGIDIILFDAEDYGQPEGTMIPQQSDTYALGSQHWSKNPHRPGYKPRYGILLDMVGAEGAIFTKEGISMQYAPHVVNKVWGIAREIGFGEYFIDKKTGYITDDHYYVNTIIGIPSIDIIQYDPETASKFGHYWHTHLDNMDIIDKNTLKAVGQVVLETIYREN
ncbi:MAG: M28 family peptidase [Bacteroidetes bacterium]|nr:M28 family peptidase [Bacteroidota bacterium]